MASDIERKLIAIASVDVAGYSRLMSIDEVATVVTLNEFRALLRSISESRRGRVVDMPGDNALVEFPSATDAVKSAIDFQDEVRQRNSETPSERKMEFRIGIHVGEVLVQGSRIYGDGVNIAARLEAIAPTGGICVSKSVRDQVTTKVEASFSDMGDQKFKNISEPVRVYRVYPGRAPPIEERAVVSAGVDGFAARIEADEEGTLSALKAHRTAVDPLVHSYGGRIAGTEGEGIILEFPSVVEAVRCSVEAQELMARRHVTMPEDRRLLFLLGIDVGEVLEVEGKLRGAPVEEAIRLMRESAPGGISVSDRIRARTADLEIRYTPGRSDDGQIRSWHVTSHLKHPPEQPTSGQQAVVVLPFDRLGNDPDQDYLVDGITEDVTTALTNYGEFRVVPRGSAFAYRHQHKTNREIARELDATYVIRGSVRATANRVRVSVELIDAEKDHVMWAERFDRELEDVLDLQDEIARTITLKLAPELSRGELNRSVAKGSGSLESWDLLQRGRWHFYRTTPDDYEKAITLIQQAIEKDPGNAAAMASLSFILFIKAWRGWSKNVAADFSYATKMGEQAVRADPASWRAHAYLALCYSLTGQHERGLREAELAMPWHPVALGLASWLAGDLERAIEHTTLALQQSPRDPEADHWRVALALMHYMNRNYTGALTWGEQALVGLPDYLQLMGIMAATLARLARVEEAADYLARFLEQRPGTTVENYRTGFRFKDPSHVDHYMEGLVMAGLPQT